MKVYNQGGRLFTHHELNIPPGQFTTILEPYIPAVEKLLKDYSTELITAEDARSAQGNAAAKINTLTTENKTLKDQVAKLQKLLLETPATPDPVPAAPAVDVAPLHARIKELETALADAQQKLSGRQKRS